MTDQVPQPIGEIDYRFLVTFSRKFIELLRYNSDENRDEVFYPHGFFQIWGDEIGDVDLVIKQIQVSFNKAIYSDRDRLEIRSIQFQLAQLSIQKPKKEKELFYHSIFIIGSGYLLAGVTTAICAIYAAPATVSLVAILSIMVAFYVATGLYSVYFERNAQPLKNYYEKMSVHNTLLSGFSIFSDKLKCHKADTKSYGQNAIAETARLLS